MRSMKRLIHDYYQVLRQHEAERVTAENFARFKSNRRAEGINIWTTGPSSKVPVDPALRPVLDRVYELEDIPKAERTDEQRDELARSHALLNNSSTPESELSHS